MTQNIGPLNRETPPFAQITLNDRPITHYMDVLDFPEDDDKLKTCIQHLDEGRASEMLGEFDILGCHSPEAEEEPIIRTAFVCPGPSTLKKCRLRLIQANTNGDVITEGKFI